MPKLSKFRIINAHYAQMKNKHANTLIDLSKDNEAHHSLLTLENGCGKGVMNQLISQLLLPETNWGENNGNRILDMFYNDKKEFHSYPMHIILEWQLDSKKPSWLITGMCITAEGRYSEEDEESVRLKYFSYITKRDLSEPNFIKNLPFYSEKKVLSYEDTKKYISNQSNFSQFSKTNMNNRSSSYYKRLNEYGIYKNEWEIMKDINTEEGGVSRYFNKAQDNTSLFDELIIPAIVENMKSDYDSQQVLRNIFTSNLSIIENLPLLIKRSEDHKNIIYLISPLIKSIEKVIRREKLLDSNFNKGMDFFKTIQGLEEKNKDEKEKWKEILKKDKEKLEESNFNKKSIEYSKELKSNDDLKNELESIKDLIELNKNDLKELKEKSHIYKLNEYLIPLKELKEESQLIKKRINKLLNEKSLKDKKKDIKKIEEKLEAGFEDIKEFIIDKVNKHYGYNKYLQKNLDDNKKTLQDYNKKIDNLNIKLSDINHFLKEFDKLKDKVSKRYSLLELSMPTNIKNEIEIEINNLKEDIKSNENKLDKTKNKKDKLNKQFNEIDRLIYTQKEKINNLNRRYDEMYKEENIIKKLIYKNIPEIDVEEMFNKRNLSDLLNEVQNLINEKEKRVDDISKKMWENNQDKLINTRDFWIPNEEILEIEKVSKEKNISTISGMQFINLENSFDQKNNLLYKYPLLPYSIVVDNEKSYNKLINILKNKHFRYPVPIYIREKMHEKANTPYMVINDGQKEIILNNKKFKNWLKSLKEKFNRYKKTKDLLKNKINNLNILYNKLQEKENKIFAIEIKSNLKKSNENLENNKIKLNKIEQNIENEKNEIESLKNNKTNLKNKLEKNNNNLKLIDKYINMEIEKKNKEKIKKEVLNKKKNYQEKIKQINNDNQEINKNIYAINELFKKYKSEILQRVDKLDSFIEIDFNLLFNKKDDFSYKNEPNYSVENNKYWDLLNQRDDLLKSIEGKNSEIKILQNDLKNIIKNKNDKINRLEKLDKNWQNYKILSLNITKLNKMIERLNNRINKKNTKIQSLRQDFSKLEGKIESKNEYLDKLNNIIKKEFGQVAKIFETNLDEKEIDIINNQNNLKRAIKKANKKIKNFDSKKDTLFNLHMQITEKIHLDKNKGKINEKYFNLNKINELKSSIQNWGKIYDDSKSKFIKSENEYKENKNNTIDELKEILKEEILKQKIINAFQYFSNRKYTEVKSVLGSIIKSSKNALSSIDKSKKQAEEIKTEWANRASGYIIKVSNSLKSMINSMIYVNQNDYEFPLVKLKRSEILPDEKDDELKYLLSDFFVDAVKKIKDLDKPIQEVSDKEIKKIVSTKKIFNYVLKGSYPTLLVYKMSEKNEFRSKKPSSSYYETWDGITVGKGVSTEGSGGQKLSISTFLMMMLLNFKKSKNLLDENLSTVLIMDNPFSNASSRHVLDPIFKIADQLGFQIIAFAPPEIVKEEISERFPVFWTLRLEMLKDTGINLLKNKLVYGGRKYKPEVFRNEE